MKTKLLIPCRRFTYQSALIHTMSLKWIFTHLKFLGSILVTNSFMEPSYKIYFMKTKLLDLSIFGKLFSFSPFETGHLHL